MLAGPNHGITVALGMLIVIGVAAFVVEAIGKDIKQMLRARMARR